MAYEYTITKKFIIETAKELSSQGIKVHKGLRNLDKDVIKDQFNFFVSLAREDWKEQTKEENLPDEQYNLLKRSFAEQLVVATNVKPNSQKDWFDILDKAGEDYDKKLYELRLEKSKNNIIDSNIYFDIINSIASKGSNTNAKRFKAIKYSYAEEGPGDLKHEEFSELLSDDDVFALSRLSETYRGNKGFTADPLYWEIKDRAVSAGLSKLGSMNIGSVSQEPISASFNFDFEEEY